MQGNCINDPKKIIELISRERLERFRLGELDRPQHLLLEHERNLKLSYSFYPLLQAVEVGLRNRLYDTISAHLNNKDWLLTSNKLKPQEVKKVEEAKKRIKSKKSNLAPGKLITELSFGFWVGLLDKRYETLFWPKLLKTAFPHLRGKFRTRKHVATYLDEILNLRNRISHHKKICHLDLIKLHKKLLFVLSWLDPSYLDLAKKYDQFPEIVLSLSPVLTTYTHEKDYEFAQ